METSYFNRHCMFQQTYCYVKVTVAWQMTPRGLLYVYRRFGEMCCLQSVIMEAVVSSETSVYMYQFARLHIANVTASTLRK